MTPAKISLFQVDLRSSAAAEKPTVAQSAKEESDRFQAALEKAEARKPVAKPEAHQEASAARQEREQELQARKLEKSRQERETRSTTARRDELEEASESQESQVAKEVQPAREESAGTNKSRARKKADDGREAMFSGLPGSAPPPCGTPHVCLGMASPPAGFTPHPSPAADAAGQTTGGQNQFQGMGQGLLPGQSGTMPAALPQHIAEAMTVKSMTRIDTTLALQGQGTEEKADFSSLLRLVGNPGPNASTPRTTVESQTTLPAQSPTFGEDLAEQAGRLRVISRPGASEQVRITLHPRDLGAMDMRLVVDDQHQVHLMITTDSDAAREVLQRQMPQLREALARQNLGMGEVMVHVDDGRGGHPAPEWGFQGGDSARQEFVDWRGGGTRSEAPARSVEPAPRPVATYGSGGGGGGLSLIV
ncbi:MAG: flagellar hook-length control protein FliK [Magnetococcales bacterium]|nr:flagellar hook-length control protein FliK [Magnetococcales bacterium]